MHEKKQMRRLAALLFLITCFMSSHGVETNLTMEEVPIENSITSDDDSEQELSSQLQEVDSRSGGWSEWSEWSACSRSCDGGVSHQLRTCRTGSCRGEHVRYKICNMQCAVLFVGIVAVAHGSLIGLGGGPVDGAAVLAGPSGIVTRNGLAATITGPAGIAVGPAGLGLGLGGLGLGGLGLGLGGLGLGVTSQAAAQAALQLSVPAGSGLEGQWIPDVNEKLYDDGSYRPLAHGL